MNAVNFPSRTELKWAGCSLVCINLAWVVFIIAVSVLRANDDHDVYDIKTEDDVIEFHDYVSTQKSRVTSEAYATLSWLSVPFSLIAIYGINKLYLSIFAGTKVEMWIYVMEKAYLFTVLVESIILPAIGLVTVSFEWSIHEYTADSSDYVPTGYYIQLYALTLFEELSDAMCVAEGLFLCLALLIPQYRWFSVDPKFNVLRDKNSPHKCLHISMVIGALAVGIAYLVSLFRFADTGFFSLTGGAAAIPFLGIIIMFFFGVRIFRIASGDRYDQLNRVFGKHAADDEILADSTKKYEMETIEKKNQDLL